MAKQLKDILKGARASKVEKGSLGKDPGVDYEPKSKDEQDFVSKHAIEKHADRNGNDEKIYDADQIKYDLNFKDEKRHGRKKGDDKKVYEAKEQENVECNESAKGKHCPVHGLAECSSMKKINEDDDDKDKDDDIAHLIKLHKDRDAESDPDKKAAIGNRLDALRSTYNRIPEKPAPLPPSRPKDLGKSAKKSDPTMGGQLAKTGMRTVEEVEQIDEISKKTAYGAYADRAMSDDWDKADSLKDKIVKKWGQKAGDDAESHAHASVYGRSEPGKTPRDYFDNKDKLSDILSRTSSMRITKSGVANKQDQKSNANKIKARLGSHKEPNLPEEVELDEVITKSTPVSDVISDFVHSDNPKFEGKSKKKRMEMALAAYYAKKREKKN